MAIGINPIQVTIANGQALSGPVALGEFVLTGIAMPAAWTAAGLSFQVSVDGGTTWLEMQSISAAISYTAAAGPVHRDRPDAVARDQHDPGPLRHLGIAGEPGRRSCPHPDHPPAAGLGHRGHQGHHHAALDAVVEL
jgi:hypothetical protein